MTDPATVVVVGSINLDLTFTIDVRPAPGETRRADGLTRNPGGKGANQAVAAARAGARTVLIGACGDDEAGREQLADLARAGVAVAQVATVGAPTGIAAITVTPDGENSVVIAAGANAELRPEYVTDVLAGFAVDVVVGQTEVPAAAVDAAAAAARRSGARFVLNPAPVTALAADTWSSADPLVVNEHEATELLQLHGADSPDDPAARARALMTVVGPRSLVVTLGAAGAVVVSEDGLETVPAVPVTVVDTTGAGDCFVGTLAACLAPPAGLGAAVTVAAGAAARAVTRPGAR